MLLLQIGETMQSDMNYRLTRCVETAGTIVPSEVLGCTALSWKAKGLYAFLCGQRDGTVITATSLVESASDGRAGTVSAFEELERVGLAERVGRGGKGKKSAPKIVVYWPPTGKKGSDFLRKIRKNDHTEHNSACTFCGKSAKITDNEKGVHNSVSRTPARAAASSFLRTQRERSVSEGNTTQKKVKGLITHARARGERGGPIDHEIMIHFCGVWNQMAMRTKVATIETRDADGIVVLTGKRRAAFDQMLKVKTFAEGYESTIKAIEKMPFYLKKEGGAPWLTVDYLLRPDNYAKVYERAQAVVRNEKKDSRRFADVDIEGEFGG